jgi:DNA-binding transcriptional ArsR family regulator
MPSAGTAVAQYQLDATFTALADPTRRAIVARLARGDATVNELAAPFDLTLPGISKHLKVLERCGIISRTRRAQFRPCHLEAGALEAAAAWIEDNRRIWAERFDKLDAHLRDLQRRPAGDPGRIPPGKPAPPEERAPSSERSDQ